MIWIRRVGAVLLVAAAVTVWLTMEPEEPGATDSVIASTAARANVHDLPNTTTDRADIAKIMLDDALNQNAADSAPKQSVVNGWTARDLLEAIAQQGADIYDAVRIAAEPTVFPPVPETDKRPGALLVIAVFGLALMLLTTERNRVEHHAPDGPTRGPGADTVGDEGTRAPWPQDGSATSPAAT